MKHGPIALVDDRVPVVVFAQAGDLHDKTMSKMRGVMARGGRIPLLTDGRTAGECPDGVWATVAMPSGPDLVQPVLYAVPAHLLVYHAALAMGTDVDQLCNLAKSVTVE